MIFSIYFYIKINYKKNYNIDHLFCTNMLVTPTPRHLTPLNSRDWSIRIKFGLGFGVADLVYLQ